MNNVVNLAVFRELKGSGAEVGAAIREASRRGPEEYPTPEDVLRDLIHSSGVKGAAWLVWKHREQFKRSGAVDFKIPTIAKIPKWFSLAIKVFKQRKRWTVTTSVEFKTKKRSVRVYRVKWNGSRT